MTWCEKLQKALPADLNDPNSFIYGGPPGMFDDFVTALAALKYTNTGIDYYTGGTEQKDLGIRRIHYSPGLVEKHTVSI